MRDEGDGRRRVVFDDPVRAVTPGPGRRALRRRARARRRPHRGALDEGDLVPRREARYLEWREGRVGPCFARRCSRRWPRAVAPACSLGGGTGTCSGTLDVPDCWSGPFDLHPDFFAAVPGPTPEYPQSSTRRDADPHPARRRLRDLQRRHRHPHRRRRRGARRPGSRRAIRDRACSDSRSSSRSRRRRAARASPSRPSPRPASCTRRSISTTRAARRTTRSTRWTPCRASTPTANAGAPTAGEPPLDCPAPATASTGADGGAPVRATAASARGRRGRRGGIPGAIGTSTITFTSLFDSNPDESNASQRLSDGDLRLLPRRPAQTSAREGSAPLRAAKGTSRDLQVLLPEGQARAAVPLTAAHCDDRGARRVHASWPANTRLHRDHLARHPCLRGPTAADTLSGKVRRFSPSRAAVRAHGGRVRRHRGVRESRVRANFRGHRQRRRATTAMQRAREAWDGGDFDLAPGLYQTRARAAAGLRARGRRRGVRPHRRGARGGRKDEAGARRRCGRRRCSIRPSPSLPRRARRPWRWPRRRAATQRRVGSLALSAQVPDEVASGAPFGVDVALAPSKSAIVDAVEPRGPRLARRARSTSRALPRTPACTSTSRRG